MSDFEEDINVTKTVLCAEPDCDFGVRVNQKWLIRVVKNLYGEKHKLYVRDRNPKIGPPPGLLPFIRIKGREE